LQSGQVLVVVALGRRAGRHERVLHGQERDRAPFVAARRHEREGRREGLLPSLDHFQAKFAAAHEQEGAAHADEAPVVLPCRKALAGMHELPRHHAREQAQPLGAGLPVAQQAMQRCGEGLVRDGRGGDASWGGGRFGAARRRRSGLARHEDRRNESEDNGSLAQVRVGHVEKPSIGHAARGSKCKVGRR